MKFYKDDLDLDRLVLHRDMFLDISRQRDVMPHSFRDVLDVFCNSARSGNANAKLPELLPELSKLICLALTIPVTTCTAERSFSVLRRLKTYLRSSMTQERLNHTAVLHVHKDRSEELDLHVIADDFIRRCSIRRNTFFV